MLRQYNSKLYKTQNECTEQPLGQGGTSMLATRITAPLSSPQQTIACAQSDKQNITQNLGTKLPDQLQE